MRVLVTGGAGMAGRFAVAELGSAGHEVTVFDRSAGDVPGAARVLAGDVADLDSVVAACRGASAEAILHLAAVPRPGLVPDEVLFRTNVQGTYNVHEAAFRLGIARVVSTSSTAVLGWDWGRRDLPPAYLPIDEDHPTNPQDAYGLSKLLGEAIARSFHARCGMETVVLRPPWIITPEQLAELGRTRGRYLEGFHHYAYIDARDLAAAFRLAVERPGLGHAVLFVAADDTSAAEPLCNLLPRALPAVAEMARGLTGAATALDSRRARQVLGWRPRHSWR